MGGKRQDKDEAWRRLKQLLDTLSIEQERLKPNRAPLLLRMCERTLDANLTNLKLSGRFDTKQIYAIKMLCVSIRDMLVDELIL